MPADRPRSARPSLPGRAGAVLAVLAALAVVAATAGQPADRAAALPDLPWPALVLGLDALTGAVLAAGTLLAVAAVWVVVTTRHRGVVERRSWWHTPMALGLLALVTLVLAWMIRRGDLQGFMEYLSDAAAARPEGGGAPTGLGRAAGDAVAPEARRAAAVGGAVTAVLATALASWLWLRPRGGAAAADPAGTGGVSGHLEQAVEAALGDLDAEADPRTAILRCYAHLDAALAAAGCPRRGGETAREHQQRAAVTLGQAAGAAARLVGRFERARYDAAPVGEEDRRQAVAALLEVKEALAPEAPVAPGGPGP